MAQQLWSRDFDIANAVGTQGELLVGDLRRSLRDGAVEVKTDTRFVETGNIYVETACQYPSRGWQPSGIANPDTCSTWVYVLRDTGVAVVFDRDVLRGLAQSQLARPSRCQVDHHSTQGVLLPLSQVFAPGRLAGPW